MSETQALQGRKRASGHSTLQTKPKGERTSCFWSIFPIAAFDLAYKVRTTASLQACFLPCVCRLALIFYSASQTITGKPEKININIHPLIEQAAQPPPFSASGLLPTKISSEVPLVSKIWETEGGGGLTT